MKYKLVCFDVDGTLIDDTVYIWVTLHDAFKVPYGIRKKHYENFMAGKITYSDWFNLDIKEWQKRDKRKHDFLKILNTLKVMNGARETISALREKGYKTAIVSGSLDIVIDTLIPDLQFDEVYVNKLFFDPEGKIIKGIPTPFDLEHKAMGLKKIADRHGISLKECVFIGDNENDVHIAETAGLSIAFNVKSKKLAEISDIVIDKKDLREVLNHL